MGQSLTLRYTPTVKDYATVLRLFNLRRTSMKVSLVLLAIAFGLILFAILTKGSPLTALELIWLLFPPLFVIFTFYLQPVRIAQKAVQNEQLVAEATWEVGGAGVQILSRYGSTNLGWETLKKLVQTRDYYLLLSKENKNSFRFLPRRAFTSPQDEQLFLQMVNQNIPKV